MRKTKEAFLRFILLASLVLLLNSCQQSVSKSKPDVPLDIKWTKYSIEYEANCIQTYKAAWKAVKEWAMQLNENWAVILDVDQTVLDNSDYEEMLVLKGEKYPAFWAEWVTKAEAESVPGAKAFVDSLRTLGKFAHIAFVTNRDIEFEKATLENLRRRGLWEANDILLCRRDRSDTKAERFTEIETGTGRCSKEGPQKILVQIGDQLNDVAIFSAELGLDSLQHRFRNSDIWGTTAFILPNPMYGSWVNGYK